MPSANTADETTGPDFSLLDEPPTSRIVRLAIRSTNPASTQQSENRSTTATTNTTNRPHRRESQDVKPHINERESKKSQADRDLPNIPDRASNTVTTTTTTKQRSRPPSTDRHDARSHNSHSGSDSDLSDSPIESSEDISDNPRERKRSNVSKGPTSTTDSKPTRVPLASQSYAQVIRHPPKDPRRHPAGGAEGHAPPPRGSASSQPPAGRAPNAQVLPGHLSEDEEQASDNRQPPQGTNYASTGVMGTILNSFMSTPTQPPAPKDKYQDLKDQYRKMEQELKQTSANLDGHKHELQRTHRELRSAHQYISELHHEKQRWKEHIGGLQNELNNVHQQLDDAKTLSEVRGKELFGAQVFLTKADTLSISEVGEKVTALNEEIFQAAATLGEALIHQRRELSQEDLSIAEADSTEMVGKKISSILISQAEKPEPEVNPLLVQVVLQIFMVKFCVSKIQSWYPGDPAIGAFLDAIYSVIRTSEEQAVSGRWRALTRAHTRPTAETWTAELSQKLVSVLRIAAWAPGSPENQESFVHRLPPIFKAVNELRIALGEKFTSADLDVSVFGCGMTYEPSFMEDAYGDGRQPNGKRAPEVIVGTTGIGLKKLVAERNAKDALQFHNVLSAKIVLESTLKETLEPMQSSGRLKKKKKVVENIDGAAEQDGRGSSKSKAG